MKNNVVFNQILIINRNIMFMNNYNFKPFVYTNKSISQDLAAF